MGLAQPARAAAPSDPAPLDLPNADALAPTGRLGRPHVTPQGRNARKSQSAPADHGAGAYDDGTRRTEILQTAATLIASSGLRTSLQEIADAAGILPGSLYHHFESKEAILVELVRRYYSDLDRIGEIAHDRLDEPDSRPVSDQIIELGSAIARCAVAAPRRVADVVLRRADRQPGARRSAPAPAGRCPGGDAADAARRQVERLHQIRHRPSDFGGPDLPVDDARRPRRHPSHGGGRPGGDCVVPNHVARPWPLGHPATRS